MFGHGNWVVGAVDEFVEWLRELDQDAQEKVIAMRRLLEEHGPTLGRPYADTIAGSRVKNLKELRPTSSSEEALRVLFYFDSQRQALLLVGGDKAGNWSDWYTKNIPVAEQRIARHEKKLAEAKTKAVPRQTKRRGR